MRGYVLVQDFPYFIKLRPYKGQIKDPQLKIE